MKNWLGLRAGMMLLVAAFLFSGCFTQRHIVGDGPQRGQTEEVRQWYVLFGLVPINKVDSATIADGARNYEVKTEFSAVDVIIGIFTGLVSVYPMTVTVTR
jgi:hypothetical protein